MCSILIPLASCQYDITIAVCTVLDSRLWREIERYCPKHVEFYSKNKFEKLVLLVGFIISIYRVSHELRSLLRESVPYVKLYRYNPKHLYPKLNGYGDNGRRRLKL